MSEHHPDEQPSPRESGAQVHEVVVERVFDLDLETPITFGVVGGGDTGWRQVFPFTYDIPVDHPEAVQTAEDE